jgi:hypothetical protein
LKALTSKNLMRHLAKCGYRRYRPRCSTWKSAYILWRENFALCILFRKNGIDIKYYENYKDKITIDSDNRASMLGGKLFRNHYNEAPILITEKIRAISSDFANGEISDAIYNEDGRSYLFNEKYQSIRDKSQEKYLEKFNQLKDDKDWRGICDYVANDCGGYWGDGVWMD